MSGKWDEVDPRVEWAMKIMDTEGEHFDSEVPYWTVCTSVADPDPGSCAFLTPLDPDPGWVNIEIWIRN
jgi:hypothetical protein